MPTIAATDPDDEWWIETGGTRPSTPDSYRLTPAGQDALGEAGLEPGDAVDWGTLRVLERLDFALADGDGESDTVQSGTETEAGGGLSSEARSRLVADLCRRVPLRTICEHQPVLDYVLATDSMDEPDRRRVEEVLLHGTPYAADTVEAADDAFETYDTGRWRDGVSQTNRVLLALYFGLGYGTPGKGFRDEAVIEEVMASGDGAPLVEAADYVVLVGSEMMLHPVVAAMADVVPDPVERAIGDVHPDFLYHEGSSLAALQAVDVVGDYDTTLGRLLRAGSEETRAHWLILPTLDEGGMTDPESTHPIYPLTLAHR